MRRADATRFVVISGNVDKNQGVERSGWYFLCDYTPKFVWYSLNWCVTYPQLLCDTPAIVVWYYLNCCGTNPTYTQHNNNRTSSLHFLCDYTNFCVTILQICLALQAYVCTYDTTTTVRRYNIFCVTLTQYLCDNRHFCDIIPIFDNIFFLLQWYTWYPRNSL